MAGLYPPSAERRVLAGISRLAPAAATTRTRLGETGPGLRRCAGAERAVRLPFRRGTLLPAPGVKLRWRDMSFPLRPNLVRRI